MHDGSRSNAGAHGDHRTHGAHHTHGGKPASAQAHRGPDRSAFLPVSREDMEARGWDQCDFVFVSGDAYVDHPSFACAIITRVLESHGYKVGAREWRLGTDAHGRIFSAVAVAPGTVVSESGMKWCLDEKPLGLLNDLGISNVVESEDAVVSVSSGAVAAFLLR